VNSMLCALTSLSVCPSFITIIVVMIACTPSGRECTRWATNRTNSHAEDEVPDISVRQRKRFRLRRTIGKSCSPPSAISHADQSHETDGPNVPIGRAQTCAKTPSKPTVRDVRSREIRFSSAGYNRLERHRAVCGRKPDRTCQQ
jgi:hypothetical protein